MNNIDIGLILTDTSRSKIYFDMLVKNKLYPNYVIYLKDKKRNYQFSNNNETKIMKKLSNKISNEYKKLKIDLNYNLEMRLKKHKIEYDIYFTTNIHHKKVVDKIKRRSEQIFIYSGYPGVILKKEIFSTKKKFLHVHGGYLPVYKGSTTNYFSILNEKSMGASAIFMTEKIDSGPIILRQKFSVPKSKILIDHVYDSYFRAIVLIKTLKLLNKNSSHLPIIKNNLKYNPYFIIHPVLKHLSILSK